MRHLLLLSFMLVTCTVLSQTVYVTSTGTKYHTSGCRYLKSKKAMDLKAAKESGYLPCSVCHAPSTETKTSPNTTSTNSVTDAQQEVKTPPTTAIVKSVQCHANTKTGTRCKRMTTSPNGFCYQHGGD